MPDAGSIQGTTKLDVQFADIEGTAALEVQSLGVGFADLRIDISGECHWTVLAACIALVLVCCSQHTCSTRSNDMWTII